MKVFLSSKRKIGILLLSIVSALTVAVGCISIIRYVNADYTFQSDFSGGKGTAHDPYLIAKERDLNNVRYYLGNHFK